MAWFVCSFEYKIDDPDSIGLAFDILFCLVVA